MNQVTEDGCGYVTNYAHDALGNLTGVNQSGQTRTFLYDSFSRLTSATNPESGTVSSTYDDNGNLASKTDARGTTYYSTVSCPYDPLNRLKCKTYSDSTPSVSYTYDQSGCLGGQSPCYNVGRRTGMTDGAGSQAWSYDSMGRVWTDQRTTNNVAQTFDCTYNYDGSLRVLPTPVVARSPTFTTPPRGFSRPRTQATPMPRALSITRRASSTRSHRGSER